MRVADGQLSFLVQLGVAEPEVQRRTESHLAQPLTREEQRRIGRMYAANIGLIKSFGGKLARKYGHCLAREDIFSCVDMAFIKACKAWNPDKGKLSTIFWSFAQGEVLHYLRSHNWTIKATHKARLLGNQARKLMALGWDTVAVCKELNCSKNDLKDALLATAGVAHDVKGFDLHTCPRPTPWEVLLAEEERLAAAS
jgi:DNA-directed RNA polymerase specialized sigma subunit